MRLPIRQLAQSGATLGQVVRWNGTEWAPGTPSPALHSSRSASTATAGQSILTLGATPYQESLQLWKNGLLLSAGFAVSDKKVTFDPALAAGDRIVDHYWTTTAAPAESVLSSPPAATYSEAVLLDGPAVYWRLADALASTAAADASPNARHGVWTGTPGFQSASLLPSDAAAKSTTFSGDDRATIADAAWMASGAITVEVIIKTTNAGIIQLWDRDDTNRIFQCRLNAGLLEFIRIDGGTVTVQYGTAINNGVARHVAVTVGAAGCILYVDGAAVVTNTTVTSVTQTACRLAFGFTNAGSGGTQFYVGDAQEAAYYTKELTAARILAHHNAR